MAGVVAGPAGRHRPCYRRPVPAGGRGAGGARAGGGGRHQTRVPAVR